MSDFGKMTRQQIVAAIERARDDLALFSGAGCGKTLVLARRFCQLLLTSRAGAENPLHGLVALTFTDKAALEMSQRVRKIMSDLADKSHSRADRERLLGWVEELSEARITTIHSFCASVLRSHAIEAGLDPSFSVLADDPLAGQMRKNSAQRAILEALQDGNAQAIQLLTGMSFDMLAGLICDVLDARPACDLALHGDAEAILHRWSVQVSSQQQRAWQQFREDRKILDELDYLEKQVGGDPCDKLEIYRRHQLAGIRLLLDDPSARTADKFADLTPPRSVGGAKCWGGKENMMEIRRRIKELVRHVAGYAIYAEPIRPADRQAACDLAAIVALARSAERLYNAEKRSRGWLDFTDLLERTGWLILRDPNICRQLADQIDQLLVDECQDTDGFQIGMFQSIFAAREAAGKARGRLFLVGDAKQSIYRFRGAQVEAYENWCRRLGPSNQEALDVSFRSHQQLVDFINHVFSALMGGRYESILADRKQGPPTGPIEILLAEDTQDKPFDKAGDTIGPQAALTAQRIEELIKQAQPTVWDSASKKYRPPRYGDIAILFSRMTHTLQYERQLARRGVPFYVVAGTGLYRQQEIFDLLNALGAIDNPADDLAFVGALRSSLFGINDNTLVHLTRQTSRPLLMNARPDVLSGCITSDQREGLSFACRLMLDLHSRKDALGVEWVIGSLIERTGFEAVLLSEPNGRRMVGNVRRLISQARSSATEGLDLASFLDRMNELVIDESRYEQAAVAGESEDVVRLMTIHKAKGLEFPIVVLPDLNSARRGKGKTIFNRMDYGLVYKAVGSDADTQQDDQDESESNLNQSPVSYRLAKLLEQQDELQEDIRKLYVAVTRARDKVVLVGADWRSKEGGTFNQKGSYLAMLDEVLGIRSALDGNIGYVPFGAGNSRRATVRRQVPDWGRAEDAAPAEGRRWLGEVSGPSELAEAILRHADPAGPKPELLAPVPAKHGKVELPVTGLADFLRCPMLYRWRHELGVSGELLDADNDGMDLPADQADLNPLELGTLLHACMEGLDFCNPVSSGTLLNQAIAIAACPPPADRDAVVKTLDGLLDRFRRTQLWQKISLAGQMFREMEFVLDAGPTRLKGKIDLLFEQPAGQWWVLDYKSDRLIDPRQVPLRAEEYRPQMLTYSQAADGYIKERGAGKLAGYIIYFLRPAVEHAVNLDGNDHHAWRAGLEQSARRLVSTCLEEGFKADISARCEGCAYLRLCRLL